MRPTVRVQASSLKSCPELEDFHRDNLNPGVFPRGLEEFLGAAREDALVHVRMDGLLVGVAGIFEQKREIYDIGGVRVTFNGFKLQRVQMATLAVQTHITREVYSAITATTFADNLESLANIKEDFELWRTAPEWLVSEKMEKAAGRSFRLYHAPPAAIVRMAKFLLSLADNPVVTNKLGDSINLVIDHPVMTVFRPAVEAFVESYEASNIRHLGASEIGARRGAVIDPGEDGGDIEA